MTNPAHTPLRRARASPLARHAAASRRRAARWVVAVALVGSAALLVGSVASALALPSSAAPVVEAAPAPPAPAPASTLPAPQVGSVDASPPPCAQDDLGTALATGDDAAVIAAAGGVEEFRGAIATRTAQCIKLDDPARAWVVVNKQRSFDPVSYIPDDLTMPQTVQSLSGGELRKDAADALDTMASAVRAEAGDIAMESGYRSYDTQVASYGSQVTTRGSAEADMVSARPGHSEHQSGLAADIVPCANGCGTIDDLAATPQGEWIAAHAWEYGWIVRYERGQTDTSGFAPEPWHLRYIGVELASAYHEGGHHTLEEFFGLPDAPEY